MKAVKFFLVSSLVLFSVFNIFGQETGNDKSNTDQIVKNDLPGVMANTDKITNERYRIGYQDTLQITIFRHPELSRPVSVNPNGTIFLPRIEKPIVAVCKTEQELADEITAAYKKDYLKDPFVDVRAVEQKSQAFGVIGAVEKPGYFFINKKIHLLEMLAFAGGPNKEAGTRLLVARTGSSSFCQNDIPVNEDEKDLQLYDFKIRDIQEAKVNFWMQPGDIVSVMEADFVYVVGNVNKPGRIALKTPLSLTQAIATAEGFKPASKKDTVRVLRQKEGTSEREELVFNLKDIEKLKSPDPILQVNDIVAVSEDQKKTIINGIV
ncbi:MAG: polysaccharide biosynthesis/export family protein, partial [Pyrinomonadaceae bacterium]